MPEIDFTIDPTTGELAMHVKGIVGPACDDVARLVKELLGSPEQERPTSEYHLRPTIRRRIQPTGGR